MAVVLSGLNIDGENHGSYGWQGYSKYLLVSWHSFIDFSGAIGLGEYWGLRNPFSSFLHGLLAIFPFLPTSPFPPYSFYPLLANKGVTLPLFEITTHYQPHCIQNLAIMGCLIAGFYYFFVSNFVSWVRCPRDSIWDRDFSACDLLGKSSQGFEGSWVDNKMAELE